MAALGMASKRTSEGEVGAVMLRFLHYLSSCFLPVFPTFCEPCLVPYWADRVRFCQRDLPARAPFR